MTNRPIKRVDSVIRWEGNNIDKIVAFMGDIPALFEISDTGLHIKIYQVGNIILQDSAVALEILLRDGEGLLRDGPMLGVTRNIVYSDERPGPNELVH